MLVLNIKGFGLDALTRNQSKCQHKCHLTEHRFSGLWWANNTDNIWISAIELIIRWAGLGVILSRGVTRRWTSRKTPQLTPVSAHHLEEEVLQTNAQIGTISSTHSAYPGGGDAEDVAAIVPEESWDRRINSSLGSLSIATTQNNFTGMMILCMIRLEEISSEFSNLRLEPSIDMCQSPECRLPTRLSPENTKIARWGAEFFAEQCNFEQGETLHSSQFYVTTASEWSSAWIF